MVELRPLHENKENFSKEVRSTNFSLFIFGGGRDRLMRYLGEQMHFDTYTYFMFTLSKHVHIPYLRFLTKYLHEAARADTCNSINQ